MKLNPVSFKPSRSPAPSTLNPGNFASPPASPSCGSIRYKRQDAYDLLTPVYGWFTEGFDTADMQDAKTLLDELA